MVTKRNLRVLGENRLYVPLLLLRRILTDSKKSVHF